MAIQTNVARCPACGADLDAERGKQFTFCAYCGTKIMLADDSEHVVRSIDEARVAEAETDRVIRLRELELEEKENERERRLTTIAYQVAIVCVIVGFILNLFDSYAFPGIYIGLIIALCTYFRSNKKKRK